MPYRNANVWRWLAGFWLSLLAGQIFFIALSWTAVRIASSAQAGLILAAASIPRALLLLPGGVAVDRLGPKRLIICSDVARALIMAGVGLLVVMSRPSAPVLVAVAVSFGMLDALFLPAVMSLPPHLVDQHQLARLQGMRMVAQRTAMALGAPLAGWVITDFGLGAVFAMNAALFTVSVLALVRTQFRAELLVIRTEPAARAVADNTTVRIRQVLREPMLAYLLVITAVGELAFTGPLNTGLPILAREQSWGANGVGMLLGGYGAGAATAAFAVAIIGRVPRAGRWAMAGLMLTGSFTILVGFSRGLLVATALTTGMGMSTSFTSSMLNTLILTSADPRHLGRINAIFSLAGYGGVPLSYALTGMVADLGGVRISFAAGGCLIIVTATLALLTGPLRLAELPPPRAGRPSSVPS